MSRHSFAIAGHGFGADGAKSLRSLLMQLQPYLKHDWSVASPDNADIILVQADHEMPEMPPVRGRILRAAIKPRMHGSGTLHWPLRVSEMLAILSEFDPTKPPAERLPDAEAAPTSAAAGSATTPVPEPVAASWILRLESWPLDLDRWSPEELRVMAALTFIAHDAAGLAQITGCSEARLAPVIERLWRAQLISRTAAPAVRILPVVTSPWRSLARRVGRALGFQRYA